jgi:hypothetical protein
MIFSVEPVRAPLPGVAGHRVEIEAVGRKGIDRAGSTVAVVSGVLAGKLTLPYIAAMLSVGTQFVSPGVEFLDQAAAGSVLPLGLGGEPLSAPVAECLGVVPGDVNDGIVASAIEVRAWTLGCVPTGAGNFAPPGRGCDGIFNEVREVLGRYVCPEDEGPAEGLSFSLISSGIDELPEEIVGDWIAIHQERRYSNFAYRTFSVSRKGILVVRSHQEAAAGHWDHAF